MIRPFQRRRRRERAAVVGALALIGPAPALDIAQTAGLSTGSVYTVLAWLQNQGIVKRIRHDVGDWRFGYVLTELPATFTEERDDDEPDFSKVPPAPDMTTWVVRDDPTERVELHFIENRPTQREAGPDERPAWTCGHCRQMNAGWATVCGRCEKPREPREPQTPDPLLVRAIADPGAFVARVLKFSEPRWPGDTHGVEPLSLWQARAVTVALELDDMDRQRVEARTHLVAWMDLIRSNLPPWPEVRERHPRMVTQTENFLKRAARVRGVGR